MKALKLVGIAMVSMTVALVSCSGSDGETGPAGKDGANGTNGIDGVAGSDGVSCWDLNGNGTGDAEEDVNDDGNFDALDCQGENGTNGVDGNANVTEHTFNLDIFGDYSELILDLNQIVDEPANYAYLYYLVAENDDNVKISIPGLIFVGGDQAEVVVGTNTATGQLFIYFSDPYEDAPYQVNGSPFPGLIVVAIELTNTGKTSENVMSELKAAGVDTGDYDAVAAYFGLE